MSNKAKILKISLNLFSKKGYESVGVQEICENSSITKPTLYYYFSNKAGLLKEIFKENCAELNKTLLENSKYIPSENYESDVFPVLVSVCRAYFEFAQKNTKFYNLMVSSFYSPSNSEFRKIAADFTNLQYEIIKNMFFEISKKHINLKRHEKYLALTFTGIIHSAVAFGTDNIKSEELVHQFMHGIFS